MNKNIEKSLLDAIARDDTSEIHRLTRYFSEPSDEVGRIYGESLWLWVRDIDFLRVMIKKLDYVKNPSNPPKRKWKNLAAGQIINVFTELFLEIHGEKLRHVCEELCRPIIENQEKRNSLIHDFNDKVEKMDEDYKKESGEDVSVEQHIRHLQSVVNEDRIDTSKHSWLMMGVLALVSLKFNACKEQNNQPTPTDKS